MGFQGGWLLKLAKNTISKLGICIRESGKGLKTNCHEKMAKNTTFPMKIWLFLMCLVIPEVQIPQKQRFWPSGRGFQLQKNTENPQK